MLTSLFENFAFFLGCCLFCDLTSCTLLQGVPVESHPSKLVGSRGFKSRYFDFEKLAEVCVSHRCIRTFPSICAHLHLLLCEASYFVS
jgi:hypothetical protein